MKNRYYFVSDKIFHKIKLEPRVPDNFMTKNGFEDNTTKRVCLSTTISGCLSGLSKNLDGVNLYVYIVELSNIYIPTLSQVPDRNITNEVWSLEPVEVKLHALISVSDNGEDGISYTYGKNKHAELYTWDYIIKKLY